ncbi:unnamed protein product, partial [marine sediment metagenome]
TLPFVFAGMNGEPGDYGFPADNITGVLERGHVNESMELLKRLVPSLTRAAIITDNSPTSQAFISRVGRTILPIEIDYTSEFYMVLPENPEFYAVNLEEEKHQELEKVEK